MDARLGCEDCVDGIEEFHGDGSERTTWRDGL